MTHKFDGLECCVAHGGQGQCKKCAVCGQWVPDPWDSVCPGPTVVQVETLTAIGDEVGTLTTGIISFSTFKPFDIDAYASGIEKRVL